MKFPWYGLKEQLTRLFHTDEVRTGHRNGERPSMHVCVRLGFLTIIGKSNHSINFKFCVYICWVSVQNLFAFGRCWPNFGTPMAKKLLKMRQNAGFRPLSEKVFSQSNSNSSLWCTLVGWVFRSDLLLGHVRQILDLYLAKKLFELGQNGGFRPLSEKVLMQFNSNLVCTLTRKVFRTDLL